MRQSTSTFWSIFENAADLLLMSRVDDRTLGLAARTAHDREFAQHHGDGVIAGMVVSWTIGQRQIPTDLPDALIFRNPVNP